MTFLLCFYCLFVFHNPYFDVIKINLSFSDFLSTWKQRSGKSFQISWPLEYINIDCLRVVSHQPKIAVQIYERFRSVDFVCSPLGWDFTLWLTKWLSSVRSSMTSFMAGVKIQNHLDQIHGFSDPWVGCSEEGTLIFPATFPTCFGYGTTDIEAKSLMTGCNALFLLNREGKIISTVHIYLQCVA